MVLEKDDDLITDKNLLSHFVIIYPILTNIMLTYYVDAYFTFLTLHEFFIDETR